MNNKEQGHISVLCSEVLEYLNPQPGKVYVDVTLGGGGHTRAILTTQPECKVVALDWDQTVIDTVGAKLQEEFPGRFTPIWGNFSKLSYLLHKNKIHQVDGILADFGTSQIQIRNTPGFSIFQDTFLDMRYNNSMYQTTAYDVVNNFSAEKLAQIFYDFGQESHGRKIANAIVEMRKRNKIKTTHDLALLIESVVHGYHKIHPATKVFQALRIFVNQELENIHSFLENSSQVLSEGGHLVCISFHSLEDRIVKQFFRDRSSKNYPTRYFEMLTKGACMASEEELKQNRSARSARLRAGILRI
jgi:16S rRNA (cytosine1402-N4)-methyltransferase